MDYPGNTTFTEMYSCNSGGARVGKRLRLTRPGLSNLDLNGSFTYDNEGRMTGAQYPLSGPNLSYGLDSTGRLYSLVNGTQTVVGATSYGAAGQVLSMSGGEWGTETRTYNSVLQLTQLSATGLNLQYHFPSTGNNGKIDYQYDVVSGEQVNYTYDSLNRLATAVTSDNPNVTQWRKSYSFDGFGNLTAQTVIKGSAPTYSASYNPANNQPARTRSVGVVHVTSRTGNKPGVARRERLDRLAGVLGGDWAEAGDQRGELGFG